MISFAEMVGSPTALPPLEQPCPDCPTDEQRGANSQAWFDWRERERSAFDAFDQEYRIDNGAYGDAVDAWNRSPEFRALREVRPDELAAVGCVECDYTGTVPTDAGRALLEFLGRHGRAS